MEYVVNGKKRSREQNFCIRYEEIREEFGGGKGLLTVTWSKPDGRSGTIGPGQDLMVTDGTQISTGRTGAA
jgi:hypothetical protein